MKKEIYELLQENKNLIYNIANKYSRGANIDDLFQVGCIGLINAYKNFKDEFNTKFSTFAYTHIMGEMLLFLKQDKLIKQSSDNAKLYKLYEKAREYLTMQNNSTPSIKEISEFMGVSEFELYNAINNNSHVESFEKEIAEDLTLCEVIGADEREWVDNIIDINNEIGKLSDTDKKIIDYRYFKDYTQAQTAALLGMSQVQVSRQETKILSRMKSGIAA